MIYTVHGIPAPQGSKRHVGGGRMVESSKAVGPWREAVKAEVLRHPVEPLTGPVSVRVVFRMPRPRYHYGTGRNAGRLRSNAPTAVDKKPDLDKMCRSTLDALGECGLFGDDCQVASLWAAKRYANSPAEVGADIQVRPVSPPLYPAEWPRP